MYLKSLELHGFKSFADKTKLEFHNGVTGVVGPNGCGKSNIVDAIRWVLGETSAKALRGGEMADVIFNGTDKRAALGMAEVTLTLGDCAESLETDFNEVSLGRRVYRDGKGEYLINKSPCRLKDIHNLLMDTGIGRTSYSIMEQGKIDLLLSSKPEDRRAVFEEAAGISKYKSQKKEALRKLDYTEANLIRIRDIIAESERQIKSMSRQASKAKRYRVLHDDLKVLDMHFSHKQWREYKAEKSELETSIRGLRDKQDELEDAIEAKQNSMAEARQKFAEIETQIAELHGFTIERQNEIQSSRNRIEFNTERAHELSVLIKQHEADISSTHVKLDQQKADLESADSMLQTVETRIEHLETQLQEQEQAAATARTERETLSAELIGLEKESSELETKLATLDAKIENHQRQLDSDQKRFVQLGDDLVRLGKEEESKNREADDFRGRMRDVIDAIEADEGKLSAAEQQHHEARKALEKMQNGLGELFKVHSEEMSRLEVLRQLTAEGEGFEKGTQAVLKGLDDPKTYKTSVRGALGSFLKVGKKYARPIEASLGRRLQAVVVADTLIAESMIAALREGKLGEASVVAEDSFGKSTERQLMTLPDGAVAWALDAIDCKKPVRGLVDRLLDQVLIVPDLATALKLRKDWGDISFATMDGDFVSPEGIIEGGSSGEEDSGVSFLQRQHEIERLETSTVALSNELFNLERRRDELAARVKQLEDTLLHNRETLQKKRVVASTREGQLALIEKDLQQIENKIESQKWEQQQVGQRQDEIEEEIENSESEKTTARQRIGEIAERIGEISETLEMARDREEQAGQVLAEVRTSLAVERGAIENLQNQRQPMADRLSELNEVVERRKAEIDSYRERIDSSEKENQEREAKIESAGKELEVLNEKLNDIRNERAEHGKVIEEGEGNLTGKLKEVQKLADQRGKEEVRAAQLDLKIQALDSHALERYQTEIQRFEPDSHALLAVIENQREAHERNQKRQATIAAKQAAETGEESETEAKESPEDPEIAEPETEFDDPAEPDWDFVEEIVAVLRSRLDSMGPVNLDAIAEFDELEERYSFQVAELEDLETARADLLKLVSKINRDARREFGEAFDKIRVNFRDMFKELFGEKAKADLVLMDDGDMLESGIDIIAKPPGKKLQSISLLSGGERSMTAVALLFAIYMVKPSPFCVLDELDAPLDEANITRFIRVLDRFIGDSQFVIVTHSKRTMSRADIMYGVSMEEFGVSKTVGVKFSKAEKADGNKLAPVGG
ncbi:MAG: chromosome segregation protein SMC [Verrucomicrobiales bacterium]|nr:chromosome segregation protein SMC [Verrucomicrobiales bacterium]